eukprot:SAG11_NODE_19608_length_463_cov_0.618132_1_plen_33_part_10
MGSTAVVDLPAVADLPIPDQCLGTIVLKRLGRR